MELNLSFQQLLDLISASGNPAAKVVLPVILLAVFAEILVIYLKGGRYPWRDTAVSAGVAIGHAIAQAAVHGLIIGVFAATVYHYRLFTIEVGLDHWPALVALFILADFAFYWEHRCAHEIRFMWASHSVHHTVERLVLLAAARLAWTPVISGVFLFYLPLVWLGFSPVAVFGMASASLTYQIFVHTASIMRATSSISTRITAACCWCGTICSAPTRPSARTSPSSSAWCTAAPARAMSS
jgi:sterol desaturase/sphingolipid hydroxylase (fatty acid hydroxylase superfamily)